MTKTVDVDKLIKAYRENYRLSEASKAVKISDGFAKKMLIKENVYLPKELADKKRNEKLQAKIVKFCSNGKKTYFEIAKFLDCSILTARRIIAKLGLRHLVFDKKAMREKELKRKIELIKSMPDLTVVEMSKKTGINENTVRSIIYKNDIDYRKVNNLEQETLCWTCSNYTKCSWHKSFTPVKGWKAEKTYKAGGASKINSYLVKKCPMYEKEEQTEGRKIIKNIYKKIDNLGKYKRICGKLRINQKCLDEIAKECPLGIFKNMLNAEIEVDNSIKTFRVEGVNYERS